MVGVKAELATPDKATPNRGRIEVSVKCSATSSTSFQGRAGEDLSLELSFALNRMFSVGMKAKVYESLCVKEGHQCWNLFVDAVVIDFDGSLLDAISLAAYAALADTVLPKVKAVASEGGEVKIDVNDAIEECEPFDVSSVPIFVTLTQIGQRYVVDALAVEEVAGALPLFAMRYPKLTLTSLHPGLLIISPLRRRHCVRQSRVDAQEPGPRPAPCAGLLSTRPFLLIIAQFIRTMLLLTVVAAQIMHMLNGAVAVGVERVAALGRQLAELREAAAASDAMELEPPVFC